MTRLLQSRSTAARVALAFGLAAGYTLAGAQTQPATDQPAQPEAQQPPAPEIRHQEGVAYVTGGISIGGRQQTIERGSDMNLQLVFARAGDGAYLADVDVTIADQRGREVLSLDSSDPLLFAQLPPGSYRVTAKVDGQAIERDVRVPARGQHTEYFHWRDRTETAPR